MLRKNFSDASAVPAEKFFVTLKCFAKSFDPHLYSRLDLFSPNSELTEQFERESTVDANTADIAGRRLTSDLSDSSALRVARLGRALSHDENASSASRAAAHLTKISVMSYNVFFHPRQGQDRVARREHLIEALRSFEETFGEPLPDVVAFQEVDDAFCEDEGLGRLYPYRTKRFLMNMIASKHPISEFRHFDEQPGNMYVKLNISKGVTTELNSEDIYNQKHVHLLNVHLHAGNFEKGHEERMREYEGLRKWISSMSIPENEPVIVAGDFNDETGDLEKMSDWVVNYDHDKTGTFVDGKYRLGSWSSRANWLVALHFQSRYKYYPRGYTKTIDYVGFDKRFLTPVDSKEMRVLLMKGRRPWEYGCEGPMPWCSPESMRRLRGRWEPSTWYEGGLNERLYFGILDKGNDLYDDLSDHFPVLQEYTFLFR